jgi:uncharacterized protein YcgL (UPF0745 family)
MSLLCEVFRSSRKAEMYLYVDRSRGLQDVPERLLQQFGEPITVMVLQLTPDRRLASADAAIVLTKIKEQGFYLQMPPTAAELLARDGRHG